MKAVLIARENCEKIWPLVKPFLERAVAEGHGESDIDSVATELFNGLSQLWIGYDDNLKLRMIATTKIEVWPKLRRLRIELLAGERLEEFYEKLPQLEAWAKEQGCSETIATVRRGLRKLLVKELGFQPISETVVRRIA